MQPAAPQNQNQFFGIKVSKPGIDVNNASNKQLTYQNNFSSTIFYDQSNARVIEGLLPDGTYGLWVSSPGVDVTTAIPNVPGQLLFDSNQNLFNVVQSGTTTILSQTLAPSSGQADVITIPHGLSFIPVLQAYGQFSILIGNTFSNFVSSYVPLPFNGAQYFSDGSPISNYLVYAAIDATNIYFQYIYTTDNTGTNVFPAVPIQYYLLQQSSA